MTVEEHIESILSQLDHHGKLRTELAELYDYNQRNHIAIEDKPDEYEFEMMDFIRRYIMGNLKYKLSKEELSNPSFIRQLAQATSMKFYPGASPQDYVFLT